jgi:hypothetical protein
LKNSKKEIITKRIEGLNGIEIVKISAGDYHSMLLSSKLKLII